MSTPESLPSEELVSMVRTLADVKASMPRKLRGIFSREYGVSLESNKAGNGSDHYTAGGGKLLPDLRFTFRADGRCSIHSYKPGDWGLAVKRAHDDLMAQSGAFEGLSIELPEPPSDIGKETRPPGNTQPQKNKGVIDRFLGVFFESGR